MHIGEKIRERVEELGMKKNVFAKRINKTRNVAYDIFKRESIDTNLLFIISKVLNYNFFSYYHQLLMDSVENPSNLDFSATDYINLLKRFDETEIQLSQVQETNEALKKLNYMLEERIDDIKKRGNT